MRHIRRHRRKSFIRLILAAILIAAAVWAGHLIRDRRLAPSDLETWFTAPEPIGRRSGDPLARLGIDPADVRGGGSSGGVRVVGPTTYWNGARAVVTHTADDSSPRIPDALAVLDRYGVKATFFINTHRAEELWPVLERAVNNGHEVGSHTRTHPCQFPPDRWFCFLAYSNDELIGSRDRILAQVDQPHVWSFAYPCGQCPEYAFVRGKLRHAGYLVARVYPDELIGGQLAPGMNTWDRRPYRALYTQAVQNKGGISPEGRTDVALINGTFDEVYEAGGIYNFLTHPNWLDYEPGSFYERHIRHIARRGDVWYVPIGPLYAYRTVVERTRVHPLDDARFAVTHDLSPRVFPNSVTIEFDTGGREVASVRTARGELAPRSAGPSYGWDDEFYRLDNGRLLITLRPNTVLEIR